MLIEAVDEGLHSLSFPTENAIYSYLQKADIPRHDIPEKLDEFHSAMDHVFGSGAFAIEEYIARKFCTKLGVEFTEQEKWTLADYVKNLESSRGSTLLLSTPITT
jgi:hypothetical protein